MNANLMGRYEIYHHQLVKISGYLTLQMGIRKKFTPKKPQNFILLKQSDGRYTYLSSLYPKPCQEAENGFEAYSFEVQGVYYALTLHRGKGEAEISLSNSTNSINNVELGVKFTPVLVQKPISDTLKNPENGKF